jgi:hypothetical protein
LKKRIFLLIVLMSVFLFGISAYADTTRWTDPSANPTPSVYGDRIYTRSHYTQYYLSEGAEYFPIGTDYSPVFDVPPKFTDGYTAYSIKNATNNWTVDNRLEDVLDSIGVPIVNSYYIVSPAYWKTQSLANGIFSPVTPDQGSECIYDVPVNVSNNTDGISQNYGNTTQNPKCFHNGPAGSGFEAGGYDGNTGYHWGVSGTDAPINVIQEYATRLYYAKQTTRAKIYFSYLYGLTLTGLSDNGNGNWTATVINTTPYVAKDVNLRAYIVQDGKYTLAASTVTDIGPRPTGDGYGGMLNCLTKYTLASNVKQDSAFMNTIAWNFNARAAAGSSSYQVVVTANIALDQNGNPNCEPLKTVDAYSNSSIGYFSPDGKAEVAPMFTGRSGLSVPNAYSDNYAFSGQQQPPAQVNSSNNQVQQTNDLAVTNVTVTDEGNNTKDIKATFTSTFPISGSANVTLYEVNTDSSYSPTVVKSDNITVPANGTVAQEWTIGIGSGHYKFIVSIDDNYDGKGDYNSIASWNGYPFSGSDGKQHNEVTYDNNVGTASTTGADTSQWVPDTVHDITPGYYPALKTVEIPKYETITEPVYGWKEVPYVKEQPTNKKARIRLIQ